MEKRTLVTSFSSLRASDLVDVECVMCGTFHRGILLGLDGDWCPATGRKAFPMEPSVGPCGRHAQVCDCAVAGRHVYLIDTGLNDSEQQRAADVIVREQPKKKRVRA